MMFAMDGAEAHSAPRRRPTQDPPRPRRPARLASLVVEELASRIIAGRLAEGEILPTEGALCDEFGFSRTVMREGLKLLEERGLIRVEQGRGTTVQPRDSWNLLDPTVLRIALECDDDLTLLDDLIAVRRLLEVDMTRAAASRLTPGDLAELAQDVERMAQATHDYREFQRLDQAFHATLMQGSGNEVGRTIVRAIHRHAGPNPRLSAPGAEASLASTVKGHRAILAALVARDGDLAATRMADHIDSGWAERRIPEAHR